MKPHHFLCLALALMNATASAQPPTEPTVIEVAPRILDFGEVLETFNVKRVLALRNHSDSDVTVDSIIISGSAHFALEGISLPFVLSAHDSATIVVAFQAGVFGSYAATMHIFTSGAVSNPELKLDLLASVYPHMIGVEMLSERTSLQVWPNPSSGVFQLRLKGAMPPSTRVFTSVGSLLPVESEILKTEDDGIELKLDLTRLPNGVYHLWTGATWERLIIRH